MSFTSHVVLDCFDSVAACGAENALAVSVDDEMQVSDERLGLDYEIGWLGDGKAVCFGHVLETGAKVFILLAAKETLAGIEFWLRGKLCTAIDIDVAVDIIVNFTSRFII